MSRLGVDFGGRVVRFRWWIIIGTLFFVGLSGYGVRFLTFNNDLRIFFSKENPQLTALNALERTYNRIDNIVFALAPEDGTVFTAETLAMVAELTEASWQLPYSHKVVSLTNFPASRSDGDELIVADLVEDPERLETEEIRRIRETALAEPELVDRLLSPRGDVTAVNTTILLPGKSDEEVAEVAAAARAMAEEFRRRYPRIAVYLTGGVMMDNGFGEAGQDDMMTLVPLMFAVLLLIAGITLRSLPSTFATLLVIGMSAFSGMGLAGWLGISLTPASVSAPTIILTLAIADSVHLLANMLHHMRRGMPKLGAIAESVRVNFQPIFLTTITTAIGFLSMNFSDAPPFRDLGNIVAMGITAAFFYSILFLPAIIAILPVRARVRLSERRSVFDVLGEFVVRRRRILFAGMWVLVIVMSCGVVNIELNDSFVEYFDQRYDFRRATDFVQERLTGWDIIEYSLESGESGGISDPAYLRTIDAFAAWYKTQPKVHHVSVFTDVMKRLNRNMHGDDPAWYRLPERRDLAAQYLLLYEMSLPFGQDLNDRINVDKSATRMTVTLTHSTTREQRDLDRRAREWLKENAPEEMFTYGSGLSIIWAHISARNIRSMLTASFGALVLISCILVAAFRSFKYGLLSLFPNLAPAFMAFGLWGLLVGRVGLALSVVAAMTLGIVVDDTVHFMSKYLRARRERNLAPAEAVYYAFQTVGTAIWVTSAALVAGFSVLTFSGYKVNADMGLLSAVTISLALVLDFFFLPPLLLAAEGRGEKKGVFDDSTGG